jgi:hypothetical protein
LEVGQGTLLAIGGSADTLTIIPQLKWFTQREDLRSYARPLRPWRHLALSAKNWRSVARWGRNVYWGRMPPLPRSGRWSCRAARQDEDVFEHTGDFVPVVRTRAWFDYLLRCPIAQTELVIIEQAGVARGHAFLAHVRGSVRVGDFVVAGPVSQPERVAAFAALMRYISAQPESAEVVAGSSLHEVCQIFEACGMRHRRNTVVYLADPRKLLPAAARLEITPLIGDGFYLTSPGYPFDC